MDETGRKRLWMEYSKNRATDIREKLILEYSPLVKVVAGRLSMYLGYNVEYDDLVGYGIFGLIDAIDKFDPTKEVKFETYASLRIRGSILDQIRKMDWIPRTIRQKQKKIEAAIKEIEDVVSLNEFIEQGGSEAPFENSYSRYDGPEEVYEKGELKEVLMQALEMLTEKEQKVILLYYYEELTLKEISRVLEVSESRISQLHTKALQKMKSKLGSYMEIFTN